jgi:hypothetical protein
MADLPGWYFDVYTARILVGFAVFQTVVLTCNHTPRAENRDGHGYTLLITSKAIFFL